MCNLTEHYTQTINRPPVSMQSKPNENSALLWMLMGQYTGTAVMHKKSHTSPSTHYFCPISTKIYMARLSIPSSNSDLHEGQLSSL
jgi:hypothetical protein